MENKKTYYYFITFGLIVLSLLYIVLTYPALFGTFELDDSGNLFELSRINRFEDILRFAFSGRASYLGRPVALFSFALQADSWPNPYHFKMFNVVLHLLNGVLILLLLLQLTANEFKDKRKLLFFCLLVYALWLLAPIHVFSTFYVIQRMTLLSGLFVLISLNLHVYIRKTTLISHPLKGYFFISLALCMGLLLGILSKESAILLCVYLLILEGTFLRYQPKPDYWPLWKIIFLWMPVLMLVLYLAQTDRLYYDTIEFYGFDSYQRLINEINILWQYLRLIIFPEYGRYGLINDDYEMIHHLSDDVSVMLMALGIIFLCAVAFYLRKRLPLLSFSILWFFGGHLLESTVIPLELYFEHRNYLPALGVITFFVYGLFRLYGLMSQKWLRGVFILSVMGYVFLYALVLKQTASSWSSEITLANYQIKHHPNSRRANLRYITVLMKYGQYPEAARMMRTLEEKNKQVIGYNLQLQQLNCFDQTLFEVPEKAHYFEVLKKGEFDFAIDGAVAEILEYKKLNQCDSLSYDDFREIISALLENPNLAPIKVFLAVMKSKTYAEEELWDKAISALLEVSADGNKDINYDFLMLQYQYMARDWVNAEKTIKTIEIRLNSEVVNKLALEESLQVFREQIAIQKQLE